MSANIVNVDSLLFEDVLADIERFIAIEGELDLRDFNESSVVRRFTSAMASLYSQLRMKIESVRRESVMHSAVRPDSIRHLAQSQLAYHPKRKIAPQHPNTGADGKPVRFTFPLPASDVFWDRYTVLGNLTIDGESYPISILDMPHTDSSAGTVSCRLGIGSWRRFDIRLDDGLGHYDPFHVFHVDEDRDVIDDSGTVHIVLRRQEDGYDTPDTPEVNVINNLYELAYMRDSEKRALALVTSNYYGGLDINFGDGLIFGNALYQDPAMSVIEVHYFIAPGFIPNFNFIEANVSWDSNFVEPDEELGYKFNPNMANGINEESTAQIKTLSPYVAMSNNRIMTNDDFITRVRRIPQIKSCASRPRHIDPPPDVCPHGNPGSVSSLVPTATFELTGLSVNPADTSEFQPLTQLEWDLNYHQQYNFDTLLGFMRVRILPPQEVRMTLDLKVVLKRNLDINARSHGEINELIRGIVHSYCWELGVFLDLGKILSDIIDIHEVRHCYIEGCELIKQEPGKEPKDLAEQGIRNWQFETEQYVHPIKLNITYQDASKKDNWYGRHTKPADV